MPRYFFHVLDGVTDRDEVGTDLPDLEAAKRETRRVAGKMLIDSANAADSDNEWHIELADERGTVWFRLSVMMRDSSDLARR